MPELSKSEILSYFDEINYRLTENNQHGEIVLTGGATLTLVFNARSATRDIDAVFRPVADMRKIISSMATKYNLPLDWLNDAVKPFVTDKLTIKPHLEYSNLTIYSVDAESLLAMKLTSARFGTKDMDDCVFLMNHLGLQAEKDVFDILDKYIDPFLRKSGVKHFAAEAYRQYSRKRTRAIVDSKESIAVAKAGTLDEKLADAKTKADSHNAKLNKADDIVYNKKDR